MRNVSDLEMVFFQAKCHAVLTHYRRGVSVDELALIYRVPQSSIRTVITNSRYFDDYYKCAMLKSEAIQLLASRQEKTLTQIVEEAIDFYVKPALLKEKGGQ